MRPQDPSCREDCSISQGVLAFLGRLLLSLIFILSGISKIFIFKETVAALQSQGIQTGATFLIVVALLCEILGGLSILLGVFTRIGCVILMIFLLPTTFIFHAFWKYQNHEMAMQMAHFLKNLAIYGGLFLLLGFGPGRFSFDARCCRRNSKN